ncbi:MAG: FAD-dependent oxidoreductase [Pseudomonadota bacterium]
MPGEQKSLVFVGCGHAHALALLKLRRTLPSNVKITVIEPNERAVYSGMLPGFVAGHYSRDELDIKIENLTDPLGARLITSRAKSLEPDRQVVVLEDESEVYYDIASIDVGITSAMPALPGFADWAVPAKPLAAFSDAWETCLESTESINIAVIGAGVAGAELAMAMSFARKENAKYGKVHLIDRGRALSVLRSKPRDLVKRALEGLDVELHENCEITHLSKQGVHFSDETTLAANFVIGAAGATPHPFMSQTNLRSDDGFVVTNKFLQTSSEKIFATGDCAHFAPEPLPKAGVYAVRQAPILAQNLVAALNGAPFIAYEPQSDYLKLISLGGKSAVGEKFGFVMSGALVWQLKDKIDTGFMDRFK